MNKQKLLTFLVITLLLINIGLLAFLFLSGPKKNGPIGRNAEPKHIIIDKLHFDETQITEYNKIIKTHIESVNAIDDSIKTYKNKLYNELKNPENKSVSDSLFTKIAGFQAEVEKTHYNHFLDIKKICKPDQLEDYNELTDELAKIFSNKPPRPEPRFEHE